MSAAWGPAGEFDPGLPGLARCLGGLLARPPGRAGQRPGHRPERRPPRRTPGTGRLGPARRARLAGRQGLGRLVAGGTGTGARAEGRPR